MINKGMSEDKKQEQVQTPKPDDTLGLNVSGHILIRDKETGQELVNKRNAIHYGNMAYIVAQALTQSPQDNRNAFVHYMGFGNGATSVDTAGKVVYKTPRVTESYNNDASMYNLTFWKPISSDINNADVANNYTQVIPGTSYTDLKMVCTMGYSEPPDADAFDSSITNEGDYVFDELALFSYPTDTTVVESELINTSTMLTHVVFHPVQKSKNRIIEIIYTVRIQLS